MPYIIAKALLTSPSPFHPKNARRRSLRWRGFAEAFGALG